MAHSALPLGIRDLLGSTLSGLPTSLCIDCWGVDQIWLEGTPTQNVPPPQLTLRIDHPGVIRSLILNQDPLVLAEAYLHGWLDFVGNNEDLLLLLQRLPQSVLKRNQAVRAWAEALTLPRLPSLLKGTSPWEKLKARTRDRDQVVVQHHYDVGNDFYRLWLDPLLIYSCAYFEHPQMSLEEAQEAKLDLICRKLKLAPGEHLLDIGCGWGALLRRAATHYGVTGYGITLSKEQLDFNQQRIAAAGLGEKLEVELLDYRDLPQKPTFDKIVSVGMIEHVGIKNYPVYFQSALSALKPGGLFLNHGIAAFGQWDGLGFAERFIYRYIFPDGQLARLSAILTTMEDTGWEIVDVDAWRSHYAKTLRHWASNLDQGFEPAIALVGERKAQLWRLYLLGSALAFEQNFMGIFQVLLRRQADLAWNLPLTRRGWLC